MNAVEVIGGIADLYVGYFSAIMNWAKVALDRDNSPMLVFLVGIAFFVLPWVILAPLSKIKFYRKVMDWIEGRPLTLFTAFILGYSVVLFLFVIPGLVLSFFGSLPLGKAFITPLWNAIR